MEYDDVLKICLSHTHNDAPAIKKFWKQEKEQPITSDKNYSLKPFFETAAKNYREIDKEMGELIGKILSTFTKIWWQERKDKIDGRRLSMMRRAVIAYLAVKKTKNKNFSITDEVFSLNLKNVIPYILPHLAAGKGLNPIHVEVALRAVFKTLAGTTPFIKAYFSPDLIVKMKTLCECDMPFFSRKKILSDVFKDKEMLPLVAFALLPFSLLRKSPFTRIERREIVKKVKECIRDLQTQFFCVKSVDDIHFFNELIKNTKENKPLALCQLNACLKSGFSNVELKNTEILARKYADFIKACRKELGPIYRRLKDAN